MAEYTTKKITELDEDVAAADADLIAVGDGGNATLKKMSLSTLANWIKTKVQGFTFPFNSGTKTLQAALNDVIQPTGSAHYNWAGGGYITNAKKQIAFACPTGKVLVNRSILSLTMTSCSFRQNNAYLFDSGSTDLSNLVVSANVHGCGLTLTCTLASGAEFPGATNNDCVGVVCGFDINWG